MNGFLDKPGGSSPAGLGQDAQAPRQTAGQQ